MVKFHVLLLHIMCYVIRRFINPIMSEEDVKTAISYRDSISLWGICNQLESIANRIENEYKDYIWSDEYGYVNNNTIISGTIKTKKK